MSLRRAKHSDLPAIARIVGSAFLEEGLNAHIFPLRREFPDDYVRTWRMKLNEHWWDYSKVLVVATMLEKGGLGGGEEVDGLGGGDGGKEVIVGATVWMREGDGWEKLWGVWRWDPRLLIKRLVILYNKLVQALWHNRAMRHATASDPYPITKYNLDSRLWPLISHHFTSPPAPAHRKNHWELCVAAVDNRYQSRGFGRRLVSWGLDQARNEGLAAAVIAARGRERFYGRCGFELLVGWATEPVVRNGVEEPNPLKERGFSAGAVMWTRMKEDEGADVKIDFGKA